jgi:hypothetical protein
MPLTIFFSDQNFVAKIENDRKTCPCLFRMEEASLSKLFNLSTEIFENTKLPEGIVFMYASTFFLCNVGTSLYARDRLHVGMAIGEADVR